ncbi:MAG: hypothetical protein RL653_1014 [Pseudomonadota bacterium]|jgi:hypothetical protein
MTLRTLHLSDETGRDATVAWRPVPALPAPAPGLDGAPVTFRRWLAASESGTHAALSAAHGGDYAAELVDGDPEVDLEVAGRPVGETDAVLLSSGGELLYAAPQVEEQLVAPGGAVQTRRAPVDTAANVDEVLPVRVGAKRMKREEAVRRFVFSRTLQLHHVDGLTYEYLHGLAKRLDAAGELAPVGAGREGREPLVLQGNGTPWRGFLEGRVDGPRYQLLLHLAQLELKQPTVETP